MYLNYEKTNQEIHGVNTRQNTDLHLISVRLTAFKEGAYFTAIRIFNHPLTNIKRLTNKIELFKSALKENSSPSIIVFTG
jgi:hypothetical protein